MVSLPHKKRDAVFQALADTTRREILAILRGGEQTVGAIAERFPISRPAVSKHLRMLRSAGLVATHRRGTSRLCSLNARPLKEVDDWLRDYQVYWRETMRNLKNYMEKKT